MIENIDSNMENCAVEDNKENLVGTVLAVGAVIGGGLVLGGLVYYGVGLAIAQEVKNQISKKTAFDESASSSDLDNAVDVFNQQAAAFDPQPVCSYTPNEPTNDLTSMWMAAPLI